MIRNRQIARSLLAFILVAPAIALAGTYDIPWWTVDGGGGMNSSGGAYVISGTIGQPDAQMPPVMSGGQFQLTGGFWAGVNACTIPGDLNFDGHVDGDDVQPFVNCLIAGSGNCVCADVDGGGLSASDVPAFVAALLAG